MVQMYLVTKLHPISYNVPTYVCSDGCYFFQSARKGKTYTVEETVTITWYAIQSVPPIQYVFWHDDQDDKLANDVTSIIFHR